jgi:hypothetical protein
VLLEGLGQLKKSNDLIGIRTRDLPDCSIAPQPTTLSRAPVNIYSFYNNLVLFSKEKVIFIVDYLFSLKDL